MPTTPSNTTPPIIHTGTGADNLVPDTDPPGIRNPELAEEPEQGVPTGAVPERRDVSKNAASNGYWIHDNVGARWYVPEGADNTTDQAANDEVQPKDRKSKG